MRQEWGREENAGEWPGGRARATLFAFFVAVLAVAGIFYYRYAEEWTPLQRFYLSQYARSGTSFGKSGAYQLLDVVNSKGSRLALDEEVEPVVTAAEARISLLCHEHE
jgi:hypothetical protein